MEGAIPVIQVFMMNFPPAVSGPIPVGFPELYNMTKLLLNNRKAGGLLCVEPALHKVFIGKFLGFLVLILRRMVACLT